MDRINHLSLSKVNYNQCIYSLAARDYQKAIDWIDSAILHVKIHIETNDPHNHMNFYAAAREYEKLKRAIESGAGKPVSELPKTSVGTKVTAAENFNEPSLTFEDVVGLEHVKETIRCAIVYPFKSWDIDSALRRSGRFERHLYVGMPDALAREEIIRRQMSKLLTEELCFEELGQRTDGLSSADVAVVCNLVKDRATLRSITGNEISKITQEDFAEVLSGIHSTVDPAELRSLESFV